ncbi:MAG: preprotein translocase subunit SecE [Pasteurellaceae bacterium]|nr:preprotein translocase subunit SecE [Pasteurellaceae bacterium]
MALEITKKKNAQEESNKKSKGLNSLLWILAIVAILVSALGNVYFANQYSTPVRVIGLVVLLAIAFGLLAITNQGKKALTFFSESRVEMRRIVWPTRPEAMQTTLIVIGVTVFSSLILWGLDSIIVAVLNFLTTLRF